MVCWRVVRGIVTEKMVCPWLAPAGYGFWATYLTFDDVDLILFVLEEVLGLLDTFNFFVFDDEFEPEGVFLIIIVDFVPMPVCKWT